MPQKKVLLQNFFLFVFQIREGKPLEGVRTQRILKQNLIDKVEGLFGTLSHTILAGLKTSFSRTQGLGVWTSSNRPILKVIPLDFFFWKNVGFGKVNLVFVF